VAATAFFAPAVAVVSAKGSSGSFRFSGAISGTLKVEAFLPPGRISTGCQISTQAGTDVIQWDSAKLDVGGKSETVGYLDMQIDVDKFGRTYSMKVDSSGASLGSVQLSLGKSSWMSDSGTITTTAGGTSGSVSGKLAPQGRSGRAVTISGSWAGCVSVTA
jgi:hypothetical protein